MYFNINAAIFWAFCALLGRLIGGTFEAGLTGLTIGLGISLLAQCFIGSKK